MSLRMRVLKLRRGAIHIWHPVLEPFVGMVEKYALGVGLLFHLLAIRPMAERPLPMFSFIILITTLLISLAQ